MGFLSMVKTETAVVFARLALLLYFLRRKSERKRTLAPLDKVVLAAEDPHLEALGAVLELPGGVHLALVVPVVAAVRLPRGEGAVLGDVEAQGREGVRRAVDVDEVGSGRRDVVEDEGVLYRERRGEGGAEGREARAGRGRESVRVREGRGGRDLEGQGGGERCREVEEGLQAHFGGFLVVMRWEVLRVVCCFFVGRWYRVTEEEESKKVARRLEEGQRFARPEEEGGGVSEVEVGGAGGKADDED